MNVNFFTPAFKLIFEKFRRTLPRKLRNDYAAHVKPGFPEAVHKADKIGVVSYAEVRTSLVLLYRLCAYAEDYFHLVLYGKEHLRLDVRVEPGQNSCRVKVVENLSSEFEIEFIVKLSDAF